MPVTAGANEQASTKELPPNVTFDECFTRAEAIVTRRFWPLVRASLIHVAAHSAVFVVIVLGLLEFISLPLAALAAMALFTMVILPAAIGGAAIGLDVARGRTVRPSRNLVGFENYWAALRLSAAAAALIVACATIPVALGFGVFHLLEPLFAPLVRLGSDLDLPEHCARSIAVVLAASVAGVLVWVTLRYSLALHVFADKPEEATARSCLTRSWHLSRSSNWQTSFALLLVLGMVSGACLPAWPIFHALLFYPMWIATFGVLAARVLGLRNEECPNCGFPTVGLPSPICPECGGQIETE